MRRWTAFTLLVLALNFAWEMMQARWFASMRGLSPMRATLLCFRAAVGDLAIATISFTVAAIVARTAMWPAERRAGVPAAVFVATALAIAIAYEVFALSTERWSYADTMPTLFGVGVLPILQWLLLPLSEIGMFRVFRVGQD
jgi:hypothetical protein